MNTTITSITASATGALEICLSKRPIDPYNDSEAARGNHRLTVDPDSSVEILTELNAALAEMGVAAVLNSDWQRVRSIASVVRAS